VPAAQADGFLHHAAQTDHAGLRAVVSRYSDLRTRCAKRTARRGREASVRRSTSLDVARKNRSARSYGRPADAVKTDGVRRISRWSFHRREDFFSASSVPRGSRGDGGRGGGAGARAKRASGDGCARIADTSCASPRGRARDDARACASRPPRATPEKNRGTDEYARQTTWGRSGDRGISRGVFFPVSNGAMPPERKRDVEGVPSCAWVTTADPRRRSRPCRSSRGRIETSVEESRMWETAFQSPSRSLFFSLLGLRKAGAGARGALRTRAPATRDARRMSISIAPAS
jgi:hypothetical protein